MSNDMLRESGRLRLAKQPQASECDVQRYASLLTGTNGGRGKVRVRAEEHLLGSHGRYKVHVHVHSGSQLANKKTGGYPTRHPFVLVTRTSAASARDSFCNWSGVAVCRSSFLVYGSIGCRLETT